MTLYAIAGRGEVRDRMHSIGSNVTEYLEMLRYIVLGDTRIDLVTVEEIDAIMGWVIEHSGRMVIANVNVHAMNLAARWLWFREFLNSSGLVFCDGAGVILGARINRLPIPERITYADWIWHVAEQAASKQYTLFLLGGKPGVAEQAAGRLAARFPGLMVVGALHGYFDNRADSDENRNVVRRIGAASPDILVVGMGMPRQELWLHQNWQDLDVRIALTGGAVLDYASGRLRRAWPILQRHSFEWLGRLWIEPTRLWRRYLLGNPAFLARMFVERLLRPASDGARLRTLRLGSQ